MNKTEPAQINRKKALRATIGAVTLIVLVGGYLMFSRWSEDPYGNVAFSSKGAILATERTSGGARVVIITADGKKIQAPDYKEGSLDRSPVWSPDGTQVFFISDRKGDPQIYRWSPGANVVEKRSLDKRGRAMLDFAAPAMESPSHTALLTTGSAVLEYDPRTMTAISVLPAAVGAVQGSEQGNMSMFEAIYAPFGNNFVKAAWGPKKESTIGMLKRDEGYVLMVQPAGGDGKPVPLDAGEHLDFDINPKTGEVALAITGYQLFSKDPGQIPEQYMKDGQVVLPFRNGLVLIDPTTHEHKPLILMADKKNAFGVPAFSPDGSKVAVATGPEGPEGVEPMLLAVMPAIPGGGAKAVPIAQGRIQKPRWSPDGGTLVYIKQDAKNNLAIYTISSEGSGEKAITAEGNYDFPSFSPQTE